MLPFGEILADVSQAGRHRQVRFPLVDRFEKQLQFPHENLLCY